MPFFGNVESVTTDNDLPYNSLHFARFAEKMGFHHRHCTPLHPQANGLVEVFQHVLVKMVHTAVIKGKDPRREVKKYLAAYRAAPHRMTRKSPYELMFGRRMMKKVSQAGIKPD